MDTTTPDNPGEDTNVDPVVDTPLRAMAIDEVGTIEEGADHEGTDDEEEVEIMVDSKELDTATPRGS